MSQQPKQENKQSLSYAFKQQVMKAWQPVPTLNSTICLFFVLSCFFLIMGIVLISYTEMIQEHYQRYDVLCLNTKQCTVQIALDENFKQPVYLYYELSNFYQNHRRYVKSKSTSQLSGSYPGDTDECEPAVTNADLNKKVTLSFNCQMSVGNKALIATNAAVPCGLIAKSMFNDTFELWQVNTKSNTRIDISNKGIAWPSDLDGRYKNVDNWEERQWVDMETNEHWMVWMRTAALPTFRKLWGRIEGDLKPGKYFYSIDNNYDVSQFDGQKALVLSTANAFGGKNSFLAISYIVVGVICALITLGFSIRKLLSNQENKNKVG